ncbi:hypothetical protein M3558_01160 [Brevibacillus invocatus]|uniref:hypothetical protein n=1 Tax=Brevibacillus invocatus TaxID=173959 RepID=UPI00160695F1|nr:hypothetical protein [Brevibacillus invocatus]MCM3077705.1 hypothetical protein [Brevibacillus invocatus]
MRSWYGTYQAIAREIAHVIVYALNREGIIGDTQPNISRFWDELGGQVDLAFEAMK